MTDQQRDKTTNPEGADAVGAAQERTERTRSRRVHAPATDIYETDNGLILLVDLPGVVPDAINVMLEQNVLTIRAHTEDRPPPGYSLVHQEYLQGDFERAFTLSDEIDAERIEARMTDGVLRLFLPKVGPAATRRIQVRSA